MESQTTATDLVTTTNYYSSPSSLKLCDCLCDVSPLASQNQCLTCDRSVFIRYK